MRILAHGTDRASLVIPTVDTVHATMSWWGGGKSKEPEPVREPQTSFASDSSSFESGTNFASGGGGGGEGGVGGGAGAMAELQVCSSVGQ